VNRSHEAAADHRAPGVLRSGTTRAIRTGGVSCCNSSSELVWIDGHKIVAVRPTPAFVSLFSSRTNNAASNEAAMCKPRERRDSNPGFLPLPVPPIEIRL
jgi:hypothetical protein